MSLSGKSKIVHSNEEDIGHVTPKKSKSNKDVWEKSGHLTFHVIRLLTS